MYCSGPNRHIEDRIVAMKRTMLGLLLFLVALIGAPALYLGVTVWRAHGGLPAWDGELAVAGLDGPVEILRDANGVAYIHASSKRDAIFGQGFVHAQDRFWQMALTRQTMQGRMAEWMGGLMATSDRFYRHLGGDRLAERLWAQFPEQERPLLEAYAAGVNAWLDSRAYRRPPEMVLLHVHPEPWRPQDAFLIWRSVHMMLGSFGQEPSLVRAQAWAAHPSVLDMLDGFTDTVIPIIGPANGGPQLQRSQPIKDQAFSNSWLLSGAHTASGLPLLANDPQLASTLPNFWQLMHLSFEGRRLSGASLPGMAGMPVGHNGRIAWGATNAHIDVNDIALIELDPDQPGRYRRGPVEPWQTLNSREEPIRVRFGRNQVQTIRESAEGIVFVHQELPRLSYSDAPGIGTEVRAVGLDVDTSPAAWLRLGTAGSVADALGALAAYTGPPLSLSIADVHGSIAYVAAGAIPLRPEAHARRIGLAPEDGNARTYLPFPENPRLIDPPDGRIVTANQRIVGDEYPHYLSDQYAAPDRALRIHELLDQRQIHDRASFVAMQMDTLSPVARRIVPLLLATRPDHAADAALLELLAGWDYRFELDAVGPLLFLTWGELLNRAILDDEMGPQVVRTRLGFTVMERAINGERPEWCDDTGTPDQIETCAELLSSTLGEARRTLEAAHGSDPAGWTWDRQLHHEKHLGLGGLPLLDRLFSRRMPRPGGPESMFTNFVLTSEAPDFSRSVFNSSLQVVYDLADLDASLFMMNGGQSGHFRSRHYHDLTPAWTRGERFTIPAEPARIEVTAQLRMIPLP
jgi:penicillin G amidase